MESIAVVMYQTSNSKGQELIAQRMVKWFKRHGIKAWLVTSVYHDGKRVVNLGKDKYMLLPKDPYSKVPTVRVAGYRCKWPPRRVMIQGLTEVMNALYNELGIQAIVTHSTIWNGPEEVAKWVMWRKLYAVASGADILPVYAHMSHYQPPDPLRYSDFERTYRISWNTLALPQVFEAADMILCVTPIEAEEMVYMGAPPTKIHIYPGGLDDDVADLIDRAKPDLVIEKYGLPRDKYLVTYLGTVEKRKNPLAVVRVAAKLKNRDDLAFVIAGKPSSQYEEVVREGRKLDNLYVLGELSEEEKASLIKASHINIIMSRMEALGLTQIEFMYAGVPVVTSAVYGQRWVVRNFIEGLHVGGPDDIEGAAKAIEMLLNDEDLYISLSENARARAKSFLTSKLTKSLIERMKAIYETHNKVKELGVAHVWKPPIRSSREGTKQ